MAVWPESLLAGDTWQGEICVPAEFAGWELQCIFNGTEKHGVTGAIIGEAGKIGISGDTTSAYPPGHYVWSVFVVNGNDRATLETGRLEVLPDPVTQAPGDPRSHARRVLDAIRATIENRAKKDQAAIQIDGRRLDRTPIADLMALESRYARRVGNETRRRGFVPVRF